MAQHNQSHADCSSRVKRHRQKLASAGAKRIEVTVPAKDTALIRGLAATLRAGGAQARMVRESLHPLVKTPKASTGRDLVAFFRAAPLVGENLEFTRDRSTGREVDL